MVEKSGLLPEEKAREKIDTLLEESSWTVVNRDEFVSDVINAQAVRENILKGVVLLKSMLV